MKDSKGHSLINPFQWKTAEGSIGSTRGTPFFPPPLQRTLRLKSMNREQRERHEQGETDYTTFAVFAYFTVKNTTDTPFLLAVKEKLHEPQTTRTARTRKNRPYTLSRFSRISRLKIQRTLPFCWRLRKSFMNRKQRERHEQEKTGHTHFRDFRVFRG